MVDEHKLIGFEYVIVGNECWSLGKESARLGMWALINPHRNDG